MMTDDVLFAAAEPGSANVLASFHSRAKDRYGACAAWATPAASPALEAAGLNVDRFEAVVVVSDVERRWATSEQPRAVLTGTSLDGTLEAALWRLAAQAGVPALAWIDQWMNLERRFQHGRPAWVAVIDESQRQALITLGFDEQRIILGGHPHLDVMRVRPVAAPARNPQDATQTVLFVSESYSEDYRLGRLSPLGYDEHEVFEIVTRAVVAAAQAQPHRHIDLVVKFHPLEGEPRRFIDVIESRDWPKNVRVRWLPGPASGREAAAQADLVIGMSSMLLLEALLMERPVISLTPVIKDEDPFIASRVGAAFVAHDPEAGFDLVRRALVEPGFRAAALERQKRFLDAMPANGSARVLAWLEGATSDAFG